MLSCRRTQGQACRGPPLCARLRLLVGAAGAATRRTCMGPRARLFARTHERRLVALARRATQRANRPCERRGRRLRRAAPHARPIVHSSRRARLAGGPWERSVRCRNRWPGPPPIGAAASEGVCAMEIQLKYIERRLQHVSRHFTHVSRRFTHVSRVLLGVRDAAGGLPAARRRGGLAGLRSRVCCGTSGPCGPVLSLVSWPLLLRVSANYDRARGLRGGGGLLPLPGVRWASHSCWASHSQPPGGCRRWLHGLEGTRKRSVKHALWHRCLKRDLLR